MSAAVLLVGLGQIGMGYDLQSDLDRVYSHARAFSQHPKFDLIGGVDPNPQLRAVFEQSYGLPTWSDAKTALDQRPVDVVTIAAPTTLHGEILREVLERSTPEVILCEKPIARDVAEAKAMVEACAENGVRLFVNFMRRSDPGVIETKRRLDLVEIGVPLKGVVWYSKGFFHTGSHFFNLLEYWLGPMRRGQVLDPGRLWDGTDPEPDLRVVFSNVPVVFLAAREEDFSHYAVELLTTKGRLRYDAGGEHILWQPAQADTQFEGYTVLAPNAESIASGMCRYQWHVAEQVAAALDGREAELCSGAEALVTLESMCSIIDTP